VSVNGRTEAKPIAEVLASRNPADLYATAFGSFILESDTRLTLGGEANAVYEGHTKLTRSDTGDYEFVRTPLSPSPSVTLRQVRGRVYLKSGGGQEFRRVRDQKEFEQWLQHAFRELFDPFAKAGFSDPGQGTIGNTQICWSKSAGKLCVDAASGLPLSGSLVISRSDGASPRVEFKVEPMAAKSVQIPVP
jgi:hypothetical protein